VSRGRGPGPWIVLVLAAVLPAVALWGTYRFADARVSDGESAPVVDASVAVPPPTDVLTTGMLTLRRLPTIVAREQSLDDFALEVAAFTGALNDRSCTAVSVDGLPVGDHNASVPVIPASNQKIVVAAVALERLGADFRYTTEVRAAREPTGGVVEGDLYLVGGGDPLLSSDWYPTSNLERYPVTSPTSLDALADDVVAAGVQTVTGAVIGDGTRYDDEFFAPGWGVGVAGLDGGPYDALLVNDSRVLGEELRANDPSAGAAREFARLLAERGVEIAGAPASGAAPETSTALAETQSAPLADVVGEMLANSDNNTAELMVKEIGLDSGGAGPGTRQAGLDAMTGQLRSWGIDTTGTVMADGSGLSLDNRLTCAALLNVLQRFDPGSPVGAGLPVAGESGTLADVFVDHPLAGRLRGKTGTLNNPPFNEDPPAVKALAGYVPVDGGGAVEYALILNGPTISDQSEYRSVWGSFADALATYPSGPTPAELGPR